MKPYTKVQLPNGLRLVLVPQPSSLAATALVLVAAGSEYETREINGLSHFLEHMCFKGTTNRPKPGMIATELDSLGAEYNAFTGQEYTGYWAKAQNHKLANILDLVADLYLNPTFEEQEIEKERGVIIEELNLYEDTPMRRVRDLFTELLYGDQPAGWDIGGRKEVIRTLKRHDFVTYRAAHYIAQKTVVVIAGAFNARAIQSLVKERFGAFPKGRRLAKPKTVEAQSSPAVFLKTKESDQTHLVLGARAFTMFDKRRFALQLLAGILGGGMSSRLFHTIREELGAAYYVRASSDLSIDHGFFAVSAGVDRQKIQVVIEAILKECERLTEELCSPAELKKVKDHTIGGIILGLESSDELASYYGGQEILTGSLMPPTELIKHLNAVTAQDIRSVARFIFKNEKLNLAVIGPYQDDTMLKKALMFS